jgi:hypothetical protein
LRAAHAGIGMRSRGAPVSSVFLYVGIVAIWAFVMVPAWLRHHAAQQAHADSRSAPDSQDYADGEYEAPDDAGEYGGTQAEYAGPSDREPDDACAPQFEAAPVYPEPQRSPSRRARSARPLKRSKVLQARRRLLTLLVLITVGAATCTALRLTSWWACIPPAVMLVMYLLLLREAALADAEQARRRADIEARQWAAYEQERSREAAWEADEEPSAEIIDISARVGDQLYDQYADAEVRAVGD